MIKMGVHYDFTNNSGINHLYFVLCSSWTFCTLQSANGLGLRAERGSDDCEVSLKFSSDTVPKWVWFLVNAFTKFGPTEFEEI